MLEIIILIYLTREIGRLAHSKGLKPGTWKIYTVLGWITLEIIGVIAGVIIFGKDNLFSIGMLGLAFGTPVILSLKHNSINFPIILTMISITLDTINHFKISFSY